MSLKKLSSNKPSRADSKQALVLAMLHQKQGTTIASSAAVTLFVGLYEVTLIGSVPKGTLDSLTGGPVGGSDE